MSTTPTTSVAAEAEADDAETDETTEDNSGPVVSGALLALGTEVPVGQGRPTIIGLEDDCQGASAARLRVGLDLVGVEVSDLDTDAATFTVDGTGLDLGTHRLTIDCGENRSVERELFVYRQTGGQGGPATGVVAATSVGLGATAVLFGAPAAIAPIRRRREPAEG
ncbi:MAG: hypothetical protein AAF467_06155 [Actinomycetota bacterium]